jgi:hypothetical protein
VRDNLAEADKKITANRIAGKGDKSAEEYANLLSKQNELKIQMDKLTADNLKNAAKLASDLFDINKMLIDKFTPMFGSAVENFGKAVDKLLKMVKPETEPGNTGPTTNVPNKVIKRGQLAAGDAAAQNEVKQWLKGKKGADEAKALLENGSPRDIDKFGGRRFLESIARGDYTAKPIFGGASRTAENINGGKPTDYGNLNIGGQYAGEAIAGGPAEQKLVDAVKKLSEKYPNLMVNAFNDEFHKLNYPNSTHTKGRAADITIPGVGKDQEAAINEILKGIAKAKFEKGGEGHATGDHLHLEMMKRGGIKNAPAVGGEAGPEAFVPLPDGRTIPVSMDTSPLVNKLEEMIDVLKDHLDTSEKIHRAVA